MKLKRFFACVFTLGCLTALIGTLSSCKDKNEDNNKEDDKIVEIYLSYVSNAQANGEEPLNYEDWLKTIKGSDGKNGENGLSAFEIYKKYHPEYTGTEQEWIDSLVGSAGQKGKSAYELAVENGYKGTEAEWIDSLVGSAGQNGKNAYELAVENGYSGTMSEWLSSLIGPTGQNGKSAYEIAVDNGYKGTEAEWIVSLTGSTGQNGKSAYEIAVENGFKGTEKEWLDSLASSSSSSNQIKDVAIDIEYNEKGEQIFIFTFIMEDGSTMSTDAIVPKTVVSLNGLTKDRYEIVGKDDKKPTLQIYVDYSDHSSGVMEVTENMIVEGKVDFTTAGRYEITIAIGNMRQSVSVTVYDPNVLTLESAELNVTNFILLQSEVEQQTVYTYPIQWQLYYTNGESKNAELELDLSSSDLQTPGEHIVEVHYEQVTRPITVYIMTDEEMQQQTPNYVRINSFDTVFAKVNVIPDLSKVWLDFSYDINGNTFSYYKQATLEMLSGLDSSLSGYQEVTVKNYNDTGYITFFIYETAEHTTNVSFDNLNNNCIRVTSEFPDLDLSVTEGINYSGGNSSIFIADPSSTIKLTPEMLLNEVDFSTVGRKDFQISYNEQTFDLYLEVYDPNVTNIRYMYLNSFDTPNYQIGQITLDDIKNDIIGQILYVSLFEEVDGKYSIEVPITEEMLDLSQININNIGRQSFIIRYMGYVTDEDINMTVDLSDAVVYKTLNYSGNDESLISSELVLYENGYAEITGIQFSYEIIQDNTALLLKQNNKILYAFDINLEENTFVDYDFSAATLKDTYTYDTGEGILTLKTYTNGLADMSQDTYSMIFGYEVEGNQLTAYMVESIVHFIIGENNTLTMVE